MGSAYYRVRLLFEAIMRKIESVDDKVSALIQQARTQPTPLQTVYLSVSIQATYNALKTFNGPTSAEQISAVTGRARAVESMHLNELFRMGFVEKERQGRKCFFRVKDDAKG
jgi:DNA-binding transcriptional ArsR family regulator